MEAVAGDRIVVAAAMLDGPVRDGEVIEVGTQGGPPYLVQWSDDGRETLFFPGPDTHISHHESLSEPPAAAETRARAAAASAATPRSHVKNWRVELYLYEQDAAAMAHAVLHTDAPQSWIAAERRIATRATLMYRRSAIRLRPLALRRLADRLLGVASADIEGVEGDEVHLRP